MNTKAKGGRNERKSKKVFEAAGYQCVKAGGSLGVWDLIGVSSDGIVLCQVKSNAWPDAAEMEAMKLFPAPLNARKLVHSWHDYERQPRIRQL